MPALTGEQQFALESGLALLDQDQADRVIALVGGAAWTDENAIDVNIDWFKLSAAKQRDLVHLVDTMLIGKNVKIEEKNVKIEEKNVKIEFHNTMSARTNINRLVQLTADEQKAFLHKAVDKLFDMSPDEPRKLQMLALASNIITDEPYCNSGFEHRAVPFALPSTPPKATEPKVNAAAKTRASSSPKSHAPKALARPNGSTLKSTVHARKCWRARRAEQAVNSRLLTCLLIRRMARSNLTKVMMLRARRPTGARSN